MRPKFTPEERRCLHCGAPFLARTAPSCVGRGKFCSQRCNGLARRGTLTERFWAKVNKTEGCWLWAGGSDGWGYGAIKLDGEQRSAHRTSWELHFGPVPDGLWVLHRCDTPACVRPDHLFLGTCAENNADRAAKGRSAKVKKPKAH